jgi:hypothetical protein
VHSFTTQFTCLLVAVAIVAPARAIAQTCEPNRAPRYAYEVSEEATLVDSTARFGPRLHRPTEHDSLPPNIIEFVVDTTGQAVRPSFRILRVEDAALVEAAEAALLRWRFRPARDRGCRVPQVTQWILRT